MQEKLNKDSGEVIQVGLKDTYHRWNQSKCIWLRNGTFNTKRFLLCPTPLTALYYSKKKRSPTHPVFSVDVCTMFQQQFDDRFLPIPTGKMKRGQRKLQKQEKTTKLDEVERSQLVQ